jgi:hypothetical protein
LKRRYFRCLYPLKDHIMQLKKLFASLAVGTLALTFSTIGNTAEVALKLASFGNGNHKFYHRLLEDSLKAAGHTVKITATADLPQPRIVASLDSDELTLHWFLQTKERDGKYVPIEFTLTQGLIGQRVMLIPKGDEATYAAVKDADGFKALGKTAGLGQGWFDVSVWNENGFKLKEQAGDWKSLYKMVEAKDRGVDYFPRGASEIVSEAKDNPGLSIEPKLLLVYPRDMRFYLSKGNAAMKATVESALKASEKSGLQKKLIDEYFGPSVASLGLDKRIKVSLKNPPN